MTLPKPHLLWSHYYKSIRKCSSILFILKVRMEPANYLNIFYHATFYDHMQFGLMASPPSYSRSYKVKYQFCWLSFIEKRYETGDDPNTFLTWRRVDSCALTYLGHRRSHMTLAWYQILTLTFQDKVCYVPTSGAGKTLATGVNLAIKEPLGQVGSSQKNYN